ncbi:helix-turn-helix transcriptional regulator [Lacticaseibacillus absianus]|uniref:helix-turn-helix transcriptional regulator n=1 Tax=Lacticaseibacillus absianus TaxID=2729623 RepID=UPI0015CE24DE|nr:helix-turn-helix transcriptional regulator [Lacticaseibacillus absianus]
MRQWLKERRSEMDKTQEEIAGLAGITRPAYNMIETGNRRPSVSVAKKVAKAMHFDWTIFFADEGNEVTPSTKSKEVTQ